MPGVRGGVHVGEGPGDHLAASDIPYGRGPDRGALDTRPGGDAGRTTASAVRSPRRSRRSRRGRAPPGGCARQIGAAIGDAARSVAEVAASHGVSWPTAHRAFVAHAEALLAEPQPTPVLGIDETRRGKPRWERCAATGRWVRVDPWDTGFVDLAGDQGLLGQREGRTGAAVIDWLSERSAAVPGGGRSSWRSTRPRSTPRRSAPRGCCPTRRSWSTTSTWSSSPTTR